MRAVLLLAALLTVACAASQQRLVERCPSLKRLPPRPTEQCEADPESVAYQDRVAALVTSTSGPLALRVVLDENSSVASVCAEGTARGMENARARRTLSANLGDVWALPPGPSCLAGRRIDLDRRHAKLAEIERTEAQCRGEMTATGGATRADNGAMQSATRMNPSAADRAIAPNACIEARLSWLFAEKRGTWWQLSARAYSKESSALLFVPLERVEPAPAQARLVARTCAKLTEREALLVCMELQRWELLE